LARGGIITAQSGDRGDSHRGGGATKLIGENTLRTLGQRENTGRSSARKIRP